MDRFAKSGHSNNGKQRLRHWLEGQINSGKISGVRWLDEEKTKFSIPWKHKTKPDWDEQFGQIFKEYAIYRNKFRPESNAKPDWAKMKTNFRMALTKAPDIVLLQKETEQQPYQVYQFVCKEKKSTRKDKFTIEHKGSDEVLLMADTIMNMSHLFGSSTVGESVIPTVVDAFNLSSMSSSLKKIESADLLQTERMNTSDLYRYINDASMPSINSIANQHPQVNAKMTNNNMDLKIYYCAQVVFEKRITSPFGCRLCYGLGQPPAADLPDWMVNVVYGTPGADTIWMPPCHGLMDSVKQVRDGQMILERGMKRGIYLVNHQDDIYAYRLNRCTTFYASETFTNGMPVKLNCDRDEDGPSPITKIFDFHAHFLPALEKYKNGEGIRPSEVIYLLIGAQKKVSEIDEKVLMYATIASCRARDELKAADTIVAERALEAQTAQSSDVLAESFPEFEIPMSLTEPVTSTLSNYLSNVLEFGNAIFDVLDMQHDVVGDDLQHLDAEALLAMSNDQLIDRVGDIDEAGIKQYNPTTASDLNQFPAATSSTLNSSQLDDLSL